MPAVPLAHQDSGRAGHFDQQAEEHVLAAENVRHQIVAGMSPVEELPLRKRARPKNICIYIYMMICINMLNKHILFSLQILS